VSPRSVAWSPPSTAARPSRPTRSPPRWRAGPATASRRLCSGAITITDGRVDQGNFDSYRVLRNSEAPSVETYILPSTAPPTGVGEPGTPVIGPAVANALLALTGKPVLSQPFVKA
jgi:CO/xanthine dehydrogenase Mo-binding subunit